MMVGKAGQQLPFFNACCDQNAPHYRKGAKTVICLTLEGE
jgi:hypothetical protein